MKFVFGDIVVIDNYYIGVVVKSWKHDNGYRYDVYVRSANDIVLYEEEELERYLVRHKELSEDEQYWQANAVGR